MSLVTVSMTTEQLAKLDAMAKRQGKSREEVLLSALTETKAAKPKAKAKTAAKSTK